VAHKLAVLEGAVGPLSFKLFRVGDKLPHETRWATVEEVEANREALLEAMPKWEIANLANGSVHGALYGGRTRYVVLDFCFFWFWVAFSSYFFKFGSRSGSLMPEFCLPDAARKNKPMWLTS
jgi:hypothetical protein